MGGVRAPAGGASGGVSGAAMPVMGGGMTTVIIKPDVE
jgi:hypothetical protein